MTDTPLSTSTVNTVLGPVAADELGVVAVHEALLSVVPGAEHAPDISMDRAEIFSILAAKLTTFKQAGGAAVVDSTGMFHGRDVRLYEALSRTTGVHIIASTGMGPEELLGGYFLTPQTNPPTPWPAEKFADLFSKEITEGMVVPRVERRGPAGLVTTTATRASMTATDESLFRGSARTALATGVALSIRFGADALHDLDVVLDEGLPTDRVVVGGLDRADAVDAGAPLAVARRGAYVALDHVGENRVGSNRAGSDTVEPSRNPDHVDDDARAVLVVELIAAGFADRILLSANSIGVAKGQPDRDVPFGVVLTDFMPLLHTRGVTDDDVQRILVANPAALLATR